MYFGFLFVDVYFVIVFVFIRVDEYIVFYLDNFKGLVGDVV